MQTVHLSGSYPFILFTQHLLCVGVRNAKFNNSSLSAPPDNLSLAGGLGVLKPELSPMC